jgi:hypothetical protein
MDVDGDMRLFGAVREYVCAWLVLNVMSRFTPAVSEKLVY